MTHPENGRFTRTIVNRLWHRLMGHGIVHPVDAMQSPPWNADLLDFLAVDLADHDYDLKHTLELIATSRAYQSRCESVHAPSDGLAYRFAGPRAKRLTAEQFVDAVWQLTGAAPMRYDAPVQRALSPGAAPSPVQPASAVWVWSRGQTGDAKPGETVVFRRRFKLDPAPERAYAVVSCDNSYTLHLNGQRVYEGSDWETPDTISLSPMVKAGDNELLVIASNAGSGPNPAALFIEFRATLKGGKTVVIAGDAQWEWSAKLPGKGGRYAKDPGDWKPAVPVAHAETWSARVGEKLASALARGDAPARMVRAALLKGDFLMRALGRPNRDQIVSVRPEELTTLEAIELNNRQELMDLLDRGARRVLSTGDRTPEALARRLFLAALSRPPTTRELEVMREVLGERPDEQRLMDAMWGLVMLPEFQLVR
jgi:hypothetical protein